MRNGVPIHARLAGKECKVVDEAAVPEWGGQEVQFRLEEDAYFDGSQRTRSFPVLYLIHGSPGTSVDWLRGGYVDRTMDELLRRGAIDPFIVVLPDVNGGYFRRWRLRLR